MGKKHRLTTLCVVDKKQIIPVEVPAAMTGQTIFSSFSVLPVPAIPYRLCQASLRRITRRSSHNDLLVKGRRPLCLTYRMLKFLAFPASVMALGNFFCGLYYRHSLIQPICITGILLSKESEYHTSCCEG